MWRWRGRCWTCLMGPHERSLQLSPISLPILHVQLSVSALRTLASSVRWFPCLLFRASDPFATLYWLLCSRVWASCSPVCVCLQSYSHLYLCSCASESGSTVGHPGGTCSVRGDRRHLSRLLRRWQAVPLVNLVRSWRLTCSRHGARGNEHQVVPLVEQGQVPPSSWGNRMKPATLAWRSASRAERV